MAAAGANSQGDSAATCTAATSPSMAPQLGVGGAKPSPTKDNVASAMTNAGTSTVVWTTEKSACRRQQMPQDHAPRARPERACSFCVLGLAFDQRRFRVLRVPQWATRPARAPRTSAEKTCGPSARTAGAAKREDEIDRRQHEHHVRRRASTRVSIHPPAYPATAADERADRQRDERRQQRDAERQPRAGQQRATARPARARRCRAGTTARRPRTSRAACDLPRSAARSDRRAAAGRRTARASVPPASMTCGRIGGA